MRKIFGLMFAVTAIEGFSAFVEGTGFVLGVYGLTKGVTRSTRKRK